VSRLSIEEAQSFTPGLARAMAELIPQVSESAPLPSEDELKAIVSSPVTRLLLARDEAGSIVGTLTLVVFRIPTGSAPGSRTSSSTSRLAGRAWARP
jgi:hypothetical protein